MKIGIYSGSFDPVHEGHISFALEAAEQCGLDKVYFLVEPQPRHKQGVKAFEHRVQMLQLAISQQPRLGSVILDQERFSVLETWPLLRQRFAGAELSMLMGDDVFMRLSHWPRVDELITSVRFVVGMRHADEAAIRAHLSVIEQTRALRLRYCLFRPSAHTFSSTTIRSALRHGTAVRGLAPAVEAYIREHNLYIPDEVSESSE